MSRKVFCFGALSLLIIIAFVSLACGSNPGKDIVGKWTIAKDETFLKGINLNKSDLLGAEIEFLSDKTYISTYGDQGQWTILDDGRIKMQSIMMVKFAIIKGKQMIIDTSNEMGYKSHKVLEKKAAR